MPLKYLRLGTRIDDREAILQEHDGFLDFGVSLEQVQQQLKVKLNQTVRSLSGTFRRRFRDVLVSSTFP